MRGRRPGALLLCLSVAFAISIVACAQRLAPLNADEGAKVLDVARPLRGVRTSFCPKVAHSPVIDGELGDPAWRRADVQSHFFVLGSRGPARGKTEVMSVRDEQAIYFAFRCHTSNLRKIKSEIRQRDGGMWEEESVELFLLPGTGSGVYYQFIVNAIGTIWDARSDRNRSWNSGMTVACKTNFTHGNSGYWAAELRIPFADLGGYCKRNKYNPTHAVSWEGFGTDYAALVAENRKTRLRVMIYSFAKAPMTGRMRVWALERGKYKVTVGRDADGDLKMDTALQTSTRELTKADTLELTLPPGTVTVVEIRQEKKLAPLYSRPDLAIAAREVEIQGGTLTGTVHNIGSADVADAIVAVVNAQGKILASRSLGRLAAPLDLVPKRRTFSLRLPGTPQPGWNLVLDPEGQVPEIYEGNNQVPLDSLPAVNYAKGWE